MSALPMSAIFGGGANASRIVQYELLTTSRVVKILRKGVLDILLTAGSGSGGVGVGGAAAGYFGGPGAGECGIKLRIPVDVGQEFVVNLGAGGAPVSLSAAGGVAGNAGWPSSVTGPGVLMTVNGGQGAPRSTTLPVLGGLGGVGGTGGDIHIPGGDGGDVLATTSNYAFAGGGSVGVLGIGKEYRKGGSVNTTGAGTGAAGAGVGGVGGSVTGNAGAATPSGGGAGGPGVSVATGTVAATVRGLNFLGRDAALSPAEFLQSIARWGVDCFGGGGVTNSAPGPGGGAAAVVSVSDVAKPGIFAGGAAVFFASAASTSSAPAGNFGPGVSMYGGSLSAAGATLTSGYGGNSMAIFIVREA